MEKKSKNNQERDVYLALKSIIRKDFISIVDFEQVNVCLILGGNQLLIVDNKKTINVLNVFKVSKGWNNGIEVYLCLHYQL